MGDRRRISSSRRSSFLFFGSTRRMRTMGLGVAVGAGAVLIAFVYQFLKRFNRWWYEPTLEKGTSPLPPGDMGWPLIGDMLAFLRAFKSGNPELFVSAFVSRFRNVGLYKAFMFLRPTILATSPEACKLVLMDDTFEPGWPESTIRLMGSKSFVSLPFEEHKRLRKITSAPVNGHEALSKYLTCVDERVISSLDNWSQRDQINLLLELKRLTFSIIGYIFLGYETNAKVGALEREYTALNMGVRAMPINLPGTAYNKALKARRKLVAILQSVIDERRSGAQDKNESMLDILVKLKDDEGRLLTDEEIIDLLVMYLNAGHESSAHVSMWTIIFLLNHPQIYAKAKAEQEDIVKRRPSNQKSLTYSEFREMYYLQKVIDESLRLVNVSPMVFREPTQDVKFNGYTIPKGWKTQVWMRNVHMDPEVYPNPNKFDPDRWDNFTPKAGMFIPFGGGSRMCPGNELAKMEISVVLHHVLLEYRVERVTPDCPVRFLPHPRPRDNCPARITKLNPNEA